MRQYTAMVRSRESRTEHTRKLVQAAYELIPEVGIAGLRTRDIAKRAGVHLATFHYCFESKSALLAGLYAEIVDRFNAVIDRFITPRQDIADRLDGHRRMRRYLLTEDRNLLIAWKAFTGAMWTDPEIARIVRPGYRIMRDRLSSFIEEGFRAGKLTGLPCSNPGIASALVIAMYDGSLTQLFIDSEEVPLDDYEEGLRYLYGEPGARDQAEAGPAEAVDPSAALAPS